MNNSQNCSQSFANDDVKAIWTRPQATGCWRLRMEVDWELEENSHFKWHLSGCTRPSWCLWNDNEISRTNALLQLNQDIQKGEQAQDLSETLLGFDFAIASTVKSWILLFWDFSTLHPDTRYWTVLWIFIGHVMPLFHHSVVFIVF